MSQANDLVILTQETLRIKKELTIYGEDTYSRTSCYG